MEKTKIDIYLDGILPKQYMRPSGEIPEEPVKDIEELCSLYMSKYGSFGEVTFYIYREGEKKVFVESLNDLFSENAMDVTVDEGLLDANKDALFPMIVVDGEIVSKGVYPDLTLMRGGSNSVNRGGTGHQH